jgi:serine beta-lactamase-like protein LACTB, mitochondrial
MKRRDFLQNTMVAGAAVAILLLFCLSSAGSGPRAARQPLAERYDKAIATSRVAIREMMDKGGVPGVSVAVIVSGEVVWSEGFGFADLEQQVPVTRVTKFGIGSITKAMTTALCARLMEKGLLDLDAPVENYLAEFPHKNLKISVRLIAGHLSGLDDTFNTAQMHTQTHYNTTAEALQQILKEPLRHRPLERHFYTTGPYTIIAAVIEKAAGGDFLTLMNQHVVSPLGLKNTTPNERKAIIPHRTSFYVRDNDKTVNAPYFDPSFKWAGAGYLSTAEDLARFGSAHLKPGFLKQSTVDELFRPMRTAAGEQTEFGLGWRAGTDAKGRAVVYQPGGGPGISSILILYPKENLVVAILSNLTGAPVGGDAADIIADAFLLSRA